MAVTRQTTAASVRPLNGSIVRRYTAGAAIAVGEVVSMESDGYVDPADTSAWMQVIGVSIQAASAAAEMVDVVVFGPVTSISGATIGANIYASDTAGEYSETVGTKDICVGFAESATVLFVKVEQIDFS